MKLEDIVKSLVVLKKDSRFKYSICLSSDYAKRNPSKKRIELAMKCLNDLLKHNYSCVIELLERDNDWLLFLYNGLWLKDYYMLEEFLDCHVTSASLIEDFIVAANENQNYELEVILIKYRDSRYGAPAPVEERFAL